MQIAMECFHRIYNRIKPKAASWFYYTLSSISPNLTSRILYWRKFKRPLDLREPKTLNEKIIWLKLNQYNHNPLVTQCADKWRVREYVRSAGWGNILNESYGVWDSARCIPWERLPQAFVLKCNHGCGYNLICTDKKMLDIDGSTRRLEKWLRTDFWRYYAEVQYREIPKRIVCEKFLGDGERLPRDYKVYCFHGRPQYILVCDGRENDRPRFYFFNADWRFCPITLDGLAVPADFSIDKPANLEEMLACSSDLSAPFPFVRVDFYDVDGKLIFGELTFTPAGGLDTRRLPETDIMFGELLKLP